MADEKRTRRPLDPWQLVRYALVSAGSALVTHGGMDDKIDDQMIEEIVGAIMTVASVAWGIYVRWHTAAVPVEVAKKPSIPVKDSLTGQVTTGPGV